MLGLRHRRLAGASGERHRLNLGLQEDDKIQDNCLLSAETFFGPASGEHRGQRDGPKSVAKSRGLVAVVGQDGGAAAR
jgi:hypothetical protein